MNGRIEKAIMSIECDLVHVPEYGQVLENFTLRDAEKFAELIIKECIQVCNDIDAEYEGEDVLATWCATAIKEHFGVE
jgi:hypothetical protein